MFRTIVEQVVIDIETLSPSEIKSLAEKLFNISPLVTEELYEHIKCQFEKRALEFPVFGIMK